MIIFKKLNRLKKMISQLVFTRRSLFQRKLWDDSNNFKETADSWYWSKSITTNFTDFIGNLDRDGKTTMFFFIEEAILGFSQGTVRVF